MTSSRLHDVIEVIRRIAKLKNTKIICVCRAFEYRHDVRLQRLGGELIELALPSWEHVKELLSGIPNVEEWPSDFKEVLRTPQHLAIFLRILDETGETEPFGSYLHMLDRLWELRVTTDDTFHLLQSFTLYLMEQESLSAPLAKYEQQLGIIRQLEAAQILFTEKQRVRFRHQSLFEHSKARLFTAEAHSFCEYVLNRQNATMVRPTIWAVLRYLRDASPDKYHADLRELFQSDLRLHVKLLLVDFLGQAYQPDEIEQRLLARCLNDPALRRRVLIAIQDNPGWFDAFSKKQFPIVMMWDFDLWPMINVLGKAWHHAHDEVMRLIETFWYKKHDKKEFTWRVLDEIDYWDERAQRVALKLIEWESGAEDRCWLAERFVELAAKDRVDLALDLFLKAEEITKKTSNPLSKNSWSKLPDLASKNSVLFFHKVWSWYVRACEALPNYGMSNVANQYCGSTDFLKSNQLHGDYPIVVAMLTAIKNVAQASPELFLEITKQAAASEQMEVHATLISGLKVVAHSHKHYVCDYLFGDDRRFAVGDLSTGVFSQSRDLIRELCCIADFELIDAVFDRIRAWSYYRKSESEDHTGFVERNREYRLLLLDSIPNENRTERLKKYIYDEITQLPNWKRHDRIESYSYVVDLPPMPKEEMVEGSNEQIIAALQAIRPNNRRESQVWNEEEQVWRQRGGGELAEGELEKLAEVDPQRVVALIPTLVDHGLQSAAARAIYGLKNSSLTASDFIQLALQLSVKSELSDDIRSNIAFRLYEVAGIDNGLPSEICQLLRDWLFSNWRTFEAQKHKANKRSNETPTSLLWETPGYLFTFAPQFSLILALTRGYFRQAIPQYDQWLSLLSDLVESHVSSNTWVLLCRELWRIKFTPDYKACGLPCIISLFDKHPSLRFEPNALNLILSLGTDLPEKFLEKLLCDLKVSEEYSIQQLYGEFLAMLRLRNRDAVWIRSLFEDEFSSLLNNPQQSEAALVGVAFSAARQWDYPTIRHTSWLILERLIPISTEKIAAAINRVFVSKHDFFVDDDTEGFFQAFANHPKCFDQNYVTDMVIAAGTVEPIS